MGVGSISTSSISNNGGKYANVSASTGVSASAIPVEYVVVGGGGAGTIVSASNYSGASGGGGAGGYRSNVAGENSGGGASAESPLVLEPGSYPILIGAGGAVAGTASPSIFGPIYSNAGGLASGGLGASTAGNGQGTPTATAYSGYPASGFPNQGYRGGRGYSPPHAAYGAQGGGGGGAGGVGVDAPTKTGGPGVESSITGTAVYRAGGGGGGGGGAGGTGGGGAGGGGTGSPGSANTGGGGGGSAADRSSNIYGGAGGSGVVIFRVPSGTTVSFSAGVTASGPSAVGEQDVYTVTATSTTTETVTIGDV